MMIVFSLRTGNYIFVLCVFFLLWRFSWFCERILLSHAKADHSCSCMLFWPTMDILKMTWKVDNLGPTCFGRASFSYATWSGSQLSLSSFLLTQLHYTHRALHVRKVENVVQIMVQILNWIKKKMIKKPSLMLHPIAPISCNAWAKQKESLISNKLIRVKKTSEEESVVRQRVSPLLERRASAWNVIFTIFWRW